MIAAVLGSPAGIALSEAQHPEDVQTNFVRWARHSLHRVSDANLDAATSDLRPMREMIGAPAGFPSCRPDQVQSDTRFKPTSRLFTAIQASSMRTAPEVDEV